MARMLLYIGKPLGRGLQCAMRNLMARRVTARRCFAVYAIIATGGKQYRVSQGDVIYVEKLDQDVDTKVNFDVLMIGTEDGIQVGNPTLSGASVEGKVLGQVKGEKIVVYKYKSKKNYHRKAGHRQPYTKVEITSVTA